MPYPNEHAARLTDPSKYKNFARGVDKLGSGIDVIFGIPESGGSEIQAIRFDAKKFTAEEAKAWLAKHNYHPILFEAATGSKESETTNTPDWGSIPKTQENFPDKSDFIIRRGDVWSEWKLPYKYHGKVHCGGVRAVLAAIGGARAGSPMSLTSEEKGRVEEAKKQCGMGEGKCRECPGGA